MIVLKYHILSKVDRCDVSPSNSKTVLKGSQTYTVLWWLCLKICDGKESLLRALSKFIGVWKDDNKVLGTFVVRFLHIHLHIFTQVAWNAEKTKHDITGKSMV